ncbi:hypothetical protein LINPERPRIM_LOCUS11887 [Linum perenne]
MTNRKASMIQEKRGGLLTISKPTSFQILLQLSRNSGTCNCFPFYSRKKLIFWTVEWS